MGIVAVMEGGAEVRVRGGGLEVCRGSAVIGTLHLHEVTEIHLYGDADLTPAARNLALARGVDLVFFTRDGRMRGRLSATESRAARRRLAQYAVTVDPVRRTGLARAFLEGKIRNQRALLLARQARLRDEAVGDACAALRVLADQVPAVADPAALLGVEGTAARWYFGVFGRLLSNPAFSFVGRNRRPPRDPVNACLSYGYALLLARAEAAIRAAGLDPYLGCLHDAGRGAPSLALDLMEEFRPFVDRLVVTLVNNRQVCPEDFRNPPDGDPDDAEAGLSVPASEATPSPEPTSGPDSAPGSDPGPAVYLGKVGRTVLLRAWERTLDERVRHPLRDEAWTLRRLVQEQAAQLARIYDGEPVSYVPVHLGR